MRERRNVSSRRRGAAACPSPAMSVEAVLLERSRKGHRRVRQARHARQQRRRAASAEGNRRDQRGSAQAHVPHQSVRLFLHDAGRTRAPAGRERRSSTRLRSPLIAAARNLLDYSATKGAIVTFTRSLAKALVEKGIRVNGVAPGPIWTPLIPSTFSAEKVAQFGANTPMKRPGQPNEVAPSFLFLACDDSSYMTGAFLHPNGGEATES